MTTTVYIVSLTYMTVANIHHSVSDLKRLYNILPGGSRYSFVDLSSKYNRPYWVSDGYKIKQY